MADRPHVLLICTDHWPASLLGVAGHPVIQTPTLDQLARNGVRFTQCHSECPVCIPARRTLMTGTTPRTHGDRVYLDREPMPDVPTLAQSFRDAGYQAYAAGKLHVYPQRNRIGFDDVMLHEEGRLQYGVIDDYELYLADHGHAGAMFAHGMCNNEYHHRPWPLAEEHHITNWTTRSICRYIQRRDPTRPGFWYVSYCHPHPPLVPLRDYLELYRDAEIDQPFCGEWATEDSPALAMIRPPESCPQTPQAIAAARRAFYALCTHIDHQLRLVIGTLRGEGLLDNTIIAFTSDHGDMLGNHGLWAKRIFYRDSANVPLLLCGVAGDERIGHHQTDDRIVGWQDIMPTLLDLAGVPIPETCDGMSLIGQNTREYLFGECSNGAKATRMIHDGRHKLIYYPVGNVRQLFDMAEDPCEMHDLAADPSRAEVLQKLTGHLIAELHDGDQAWAESGQLIGLPARPTTPGANRALSGQRGWHWPPPSDSRR